MTESITCPVCGATSYNPNDVAEGYCGACHAWTSHRDPELRRIYQEIARLSYSSRERALEGAMQRAVERAVERPFPDNDDAYQQHFPTDTEEQQMSPDRTTEIPPKVAGHVLWAYQCGGGLEPGSFVKHLLEAWRHADPDNAARLAQAFPAYGAAIDLLSVPHIGGGVAELRRIAREEG